MTNDSPYDRLREMSWRRPLTRPEQIELEAWLAAHPEAQAEWESEAALSHTLSLLPEVPVSSNFTAQVMGAVERETLAALRLKRERGIWWRVQRWLPRVAFATVLLGLGVLSYQQTQGIRLKGMARSVAAVSDVSSLPSPQILRDFEAIRHLNQTPPADEELLTLLK